MNSHYRIDGCGTQWVTFVTGIANDLGMWDAQVAALEEDFRILRYDLRGHGGTPATQAPYTIELLVEDLIELLDRLSIRRTHLVGLGLGGALVQAAAIGHPQRVAKLMPCCCRAQMVREFAALWHKLREQVQQDGMESIVEPTVQRWFSDEFKHNHPDVLQRVREMIRRTTLEGYLGATAAFLGLNLESELPRIKSPTLYLSGADDALGGPPALMERLASMVPGATHRSVRDAAHIANIQNPSGFNLALVDFLKGREGSGRTRAI